MERLTEGRSHAHPADGVAVAAIGCAWPAIRATATDAPGRGGRRRPGPRSPGSSRSPVEPRRLTRPDGRRMGGRRAGRAAGALARGRRPAHPGLVPRGAPARRPARAAGASRSTAGRRRCTAGRCSGSGSAWSRRASASTPATRAARRATARTSCTPTSATGATGPMADVMAGVDALVADGLVDPDRLGVTGGSYGGYLTAWIVGHTDRFAAAVACRGGLRHDLGDAQRRHRRAALRQVRVRRQPVGGPRAVPAAQPHHLRRRDPDTPLLIQHAEKDLRCPITQAEELFTVLRSLQRPVRLMRVPGRVARADPQRRALPARREHRADPRLVRPLPGRGQAGAAAGMTDGGRWSGAAVDVGQQQRPPPGRVRWVVVGCARWRTRACSSGSGRIVDQAGRLPAEARRSTVAAVAGYVERARSLGASTVALVGTEPLRRASDRSVFQSDGAASDGCAAPRRCRMRRRRS